MFDRSAPALAIFALASALPIGAAAAAETDVARALEVDPRPHAIYVEAVGWTTLGGGVSLDYEYRIDDVFALSVGPTATLNAYHDEGEILFGGRLNAHFFIGSGEHRLELGAGVSLLTSGDDGGLAALPNAVVAWRYQPLDGGVLVRVGAMLANGISAPVGLSVGASF
ncbi:MAG: hypothetical protein IT385_14495 [Deltaproteobacteria bacterium]|nr:hypothetical protein [Deltaproteobacteria bacterium]